MPKVALITGVTGMVGSHLADYMLANTPHDIVGLHRWRSPLDNISHLLPRANNCDRFTLVNADLRDSISIRSMIDRVRPDYVFHLAAQSYPKTSFEAPLETFDTNIQGTERLLAAIKDLCPHAKIHVCSSSEVFGRVTSDKLPIDESCGFHPASPYAISKVGTDLIGRYYAEAFGLKVAITRMFTHTGPRRGDVFAESSFAKQLALIEAELIPPIVKVGNLDSLRTIADVRDAVRAYSLLLESDFPSGEAYNIGGDKVLTVGELLEFLIGNSIFEGNIEVVRDPDRFRPIDADLQVPDTSKFKNLTGWEPLISFEDTMLDLLQYWRDRVSAGSANSILVR